jgi:hypothetical protein
MAMFSVKCNMLNPSIEMNVRYMSAYTLIANQYLLCCQAAVVISQGTARHRLQFIIGDQSLPYNMTVYQAVRQFSQSGNDQSETDTDNEAPLGNSGVWVQTHTIYYKQVLLSRRLNRNLFLQELL